MAGDGDLDLMTDQAHSARIYDFFLGGKDNYPADREAGENALRVFPGARTAAQQNRAFMHRAVRYLAEAGIRQFLDIGTGIPTSPNLHEVAQGIEPASRVVYVDNDPIVLAHAAALMVSHPSGRNSFVLADALDAAALLENPKLRDTLDLDEPVALSVVGMLHFVPDADAAAGMVRTILDRLAPGSHLVLTHGTTDIAAEEIAASTKAYRSSGVQGTPRTRQEIVDLFLPGLEVLEPGVVVPQLWRPDGDSGLGPDEVPIYAVVARKP